MADIVGKKMKVLYIISYLDAGGAQYLLLDTVKRLDKRKFIPLVCCLHRERGIGNLFMNEGIKVYYLKRKILVNPLIAGDIVEVIRKEKPDIIHTHLPHSTVWGRLASVMAGCKNVFTTEHNVTVWEKGYYPFIKHSIFSLLYKLTYRFNSRIIAVSKSVRKQMIEEFKIPEDMIVVNYNGIDFEKVKVETKDSGIYAGLSHPIIGTVGRLFKEKGHIFLIDSFMRVKEEYPRANLILVGDGREKEAIEDRVKSYNLHDSVHFMGTRNDIIPLMNGMDIFVFPSIKEGLGIALIEALALGRPCVASSAGGIPEIIVDGENGLLVPPGDSSALSDAIIGLLENNDLRERLTEKSRSSVKEKFDIEESVSTLEDVYLNFTKER